MSLLRKIVKIQREKKLFPKNCKVLIGFSGGVDSVVLYHALKELKHFLSIKELALAHFNHRLRDTSERDEKFCINFAKREGVKLFIESRDVRKFAEFKKLNIEEAGRLLRYEFFKRVCEEEGYDLVATAHHLNDLAETIIMWLARGTGIEGLKGFEPKEDNIVRPLYYVKKEEIIEFAINNKIEWVEDETNLSENLSRNIIRLKVIPALKEFNKNIEETFLQTKLIVEAEDELLNKITEEAYNKSLISRYMLNARTLRKYHVAIQRRVLKRWTGLKSFRKIEQIRRLLHKGGKAYIGEGKIVESKEGKLCIILKN